ncbi:MAG: hypothetical protein Q8920_08090 [Bacillota bacterium]|nr:hypothetical protein [Bacillota bacterium]
MSTFSKLVMNDIGIAKNRNRQFAYWSKIYFFTAIICGFIIYTVLLLTSQVTPEVIGIAPAFLLFTSFFTSMAMIIREWKGNTVGWWLQLPYSRKMLLGAKFTAGFIRFLRVAVIALVISLAFWIEGMILKPSIWKHYDVGYVTTELGKMYIEILALCPLLIVSGMLFAILRHTKFRPVSPLFWVAYGGLISLMFSTFFNSKTNTDFRSTWTFAFPGLSTGTTLIVGILLSFVLAYLIFQFAAFLLEKHAEV